MGEAGAMVTLGVAAVGGGFSVDGCVGLLCVGLVITLCNVAVFGPCDNTV